MNVNDWLERLFDDLREAGQEQSVRVIDRFTDHVCDLEMARADALLPEARALSKTLANPWLDVYVRHWEMRNRVGSRFEGETALPDAVALFELAHRDDTATCPQSICATQDLSACYANIDGPGWVNERIEVCEETLARIDTTWTCYQCLSTEKAEALLDDGRPEDALAFLDAQEARLLADGQEVYDSLAETRLAIRLAQGEGELALGIVLALEAKVDGPEWKKSSEPRKLYKAHALALLGRDAEAVEMLLPWSEISPRGRVTWLRTVLLLVERAPERNHWQLGSQLHKTLEHFASVGAHRAVVDLAALCIRAALRRGATWSARRHLALARTHAARLQRDRGAAALLDGLAAEINATPGQSVLPAPAPELLAFLAAQAARDPEKEVQWLVEAVRQQPDDVELHEVAVSALQACSAEADAIALLWHYVERHAAQQEKLAYSLLNLLLERGDDAGIDRLARLYEPRVPATAWWCRARQAERQADWPAAEAACRALLADAPDSHGARVLLARSLMAQQRFAEAAECYRTLAELVDEPNGARWDHMMAASAARDWAAVRATAQSLEITLSEPAGGDVDGPVEEEWGWIIVRCDEDGEPLDYYARRTGPVTARIAEIAFGNRRQRVGDWVVFDAGMLVKPPEDEEERQRFIGTYRAVHVLEGGGYGPGWFVDGVDPGDEAFAALRASFEARGWRTWVHSGSDYTVKDPADPDGAPLKGRYFTVAQPVDEPALDLHAALRDGTAGWAHPLCWLRLAQACDADVQTHRDLIDRYGL